MALELNAVAHPPAEVETAPPLLIAHGLFGAARNFGTLAKRLAGPRRVVAVDMRNHGASPWDARMDYAAMAGDLAAAVDRHCEGRAAVMGHSMGGKAAMALALTAPERVAALVVLDIAPVAYDHAHAGHVAAMKAVDLGAVRRRSDAEAALAPAVAEPAVRAFLAQNLVIDGDGARWRINLEALGAGLGDLTGWPADWPGAYDGPALFLHGTASPYVGPEHHAAIRALFPAAEIRGIEGAGHWVHAERPEAVHETVAEWLAGRPPAA